MCDLFDVADISSHVHETDMGGFTDGWWVAVPIAYESLPFVNVVFDDYGYTCVEDTVVLLDNTMGVDYIIKRYQNVGLNPDGTIHYKEWTEIH